MLIDPNRIKVPQHRLDSNALLLHNMGVTKLTGGRLDAGETMAFSRQLEAVQAAIITTDFPALKARQLIPLATDVPSFSDSFVWRRRIASGNAEWISSEADDIPEVAGKYVEDRAPIRLYGIGFSYGIIESQKAALLNINLPSDKALDAKEEAERFGDNVAAFGDSDRGIAGFLNATDSMGVVIEPTTGYTLNIAAATGVQVLDNLNKFTQSVFVASSEVYETKRIVVDTTTWSIITTKRLGDNDGRTVIQAWREANPGVDIVSWNKTNLAAASGTGPRWVAYDPNVNKVKLVWPTAYQQIPPQARNLRFVVPGYAEIGGVVILKPLSMRYLDGIVFA